MKPSRIAAVVAEVAVLSAHRRPEARRALRWAWHRPNRVLALTAGPVLALAWWVGGLRGPFGLLCPVLLLGLLVGGPLCFVVAALIHDAEVRADACMDCQREQAGNQTDSPFDEWCRRLDARLDDGGR